MSFNPYAPPVAIVETPPNSVQGTPQFFAVPAWKLILMCLVTVGLYQLYWFYKNWALVKTRDRSDIWPAPRALFSVIFCYSLFARIRKDGVASNLSGPPAAGVLAFVYIVAGIAWRLPGLAGLLGAVTWFALIPIQDHANRINAKAMPGGDRNARLSWLNRVAIVLGGMFNVLMIYGLSIDKT